MIVKYFLICVRCITFETVELRLTEVGMLLHHDLGVCHIPNSDFDPYDSKTLSDLYMVHNFCTVSLILYSEAL